MAGWFPPKGWPPGMHLESPSTPSDAPLLRSSAELHRTTSDPSVFPHAKQVGWRQLLRSIYVVAAAFYSDPETRSKAVAMTVMVLVMMMGFAGLNLWILDMFRRFQNALHDKDQETFYSTIKKMVIVILATMPVAALRDWLKGSLALEWRRYLTRKLMVMYIGDSQAYYRLKLVGGDLDNPDQRMTQDTAEFTSALLTFSIGVMQAVIVILTQSGMLLSISGELFLFVVGYSLLMNVLTFGIFGGRLTAVNRKTLAQEASLRFGLVRVRENAEPIAFYQGARFEQARCGEFFAEVMTTRYHQLCINITMDSLVGVMGMLMNVMPYVVVAGKYFSGEMDFGAMSEAGAVLGGLERAFTTLVGQMTAITNMSAQAIRIRQLWEALEQIDRSHEQRDIDDGTLLERGGELGLRCISLVELRADSPVRSGDVLLRLEDVTLQPPFGQVPLVHDLSLELRVQESLLVCGPSGIGKSSLLRAIGGLWAGGHGTIERAASSQSFFVPQEPYLCLGTLRDNAVYPGKVDGRMEDAGPSDADIQDALAAVNLGYLLERFDLDERVNLDTVLSGGERQRLGFARLLLRPKGLRFAILDEATSALDEANEAQVYRLLRQSVLSYVSVGHRANLVAFHTHRLLLDRTPMGQCTWRMEVSGPACDSTMLEAANAKGDGVYGDSKANNGRRWATVEEGNRLDGALEERWDPL